VVAAQQKEGFLIDKLVAKQQANCFDGLPCAIDVISKKQVPSLSIEEGGRERKEVTSKKIGERIISHGSKSFT